MKSNGLVINLLKFNHLNFFINDIERYFPISSFVFPCFLRVYKVSWQLMQGEL